MTDRSAKIMRAATLAAFAVAALLLVRALLVAGGRGDELVDSEAREGEVSPAGALNLNIGPDRELVVRGYPFVFEETNEFRLCTGKSKHDPPRCIGPHLELTDLDPAQLAMKRERDRDRKLTVRYGEPIGVVGTIDGTRFRVQSVVR